MIVFDTTVLAYAAGGEHPLRQPCRDLVSVAAIGPARMTTTVEVLQEFVHVHALRRERAVAVALGESYVDVLRPLLLVSEQTLRAGLGLFARHRRPGAFDCVLAAAVIEQGATLVSADRAFADLPGIDLVVPDAAGVAGLLP